LLSLADAGAAACAQIAGAANCIASAAAAADIRLYLHAPISSPP
jgi:hypothetical protein